MLTKIAVCVAIGAKLLALSCSNPQSLTRFEPEKNIQNLQLNVNENGDAVIFCCLKEADGTLLVAQNCHEGKWLEPCVVAKVDSAIWLLNTYLDSQGTTFASWQALKNSFQDTVLNPIQSASKQPREKWCVNPHFYSQKDVYLRHMCMDKEGKLFLAGTEPHHINLSVVDSNLPCCQSLLLQLPLPDGYCAKSHVAYGKNNTAFAVWIKQQPIKSVWSPYVQYTLEGIWYQGNHRWSLCDKIHEVQLPDVFDISAVGLLKILLDSKDNPTIVWQQYERDKTSKLRAMTRVKDAWVGPVDLCAPTKSISDLQLSVDGKDNWVVVWQSYSEEEKIAHSIINAAYKPWGQAWTPVVQISGNHPWATSPVLASNHLGNFVVLWRTDSQKPSPIYGSVYSDEFSAWSKPVRLTPEGMNYLNPAVAFDEQGKGYVTFIQCSEKKELQIAELSLK